MIRPLCALAHVRGDQLAEPGQAEHVDLELAPGLVDRDVLDRAVRAVAGVVDEYVDPAGLADHPLDARHHRGVVGDVHGERVHAGRLQGGHPLEATRDGVHLEAGLVQTEGGLLADAAGSTGDECDASAHAVILPVVP